MRVYFTDNRLASGFATVATPSAAGRAAAGVRRAGTVVRSPLERKERKGAADGDMSAADVSVLNHSPPPTYSSLLLGVRTRA